MVGKLEKRGIYWCKARIFWDYYLGYRILLTLWQQNLHYSRDLVIFEGFPNLLPTLNSALSHTYTALHCVHIRRSHVLDLFNGSDHPCCPVPCDRGPVPASIPQWCQHVEKVSGPENTPEHPNL